MLVMPSGGKYLTYDYRFNGVKKKYSIGVYLKISPKDAREKLIDVKYLLTSGINSNEVKKVSKFIDTTENTFNGIASQWFEKNKAKWIPGRA